MYNREKAGVSVRCAAEGQIVPERRVVVTGMGVVSCLGHDPDEFYGNLLEVERTLWSETRTTVQCESLLSMD